MSVTKRMVVVVTHALIQLEVTIVAVIVAIPFFKMEKLVKVCDRCSKNYYVLLISRCQ